MQPTRGERAVWASFPACFVFWGCGWGVVFVGTGGGEGCLCQCCCSEGAGPCVRSGSGVPEELGAGQRRPNPSTDHHAPLGRFQGQGSLPGSPGGGAGTVGISAWRQHVAQAPEALGAGGPGSCPAFCPAGPYSEQPLSFLPALAVQEGPTEAQGCSGGIIRAPSSPASQPGHEP